MRVEGVVRDATGAAIAGARVLLQSGSLSTSTITGPGGRFAFDSVPQPRGTIVASAAGFAQAERDWQATSANAAHLEIVLQVSALSEQVVVTATRIETRLGDVAGSALALTAEDLAVIPALTIDDKLRQIPGFTLFRRSGSRVANPTSQGVSLSGLGASGASRALVLVDGVPLNDPFGGWIYWSRITQQELSRVEVVRRGSSSLYGGDSLGGVIQFFFRPVEGPAFSLDASYGNQQTPDLSFWTGGRLHNWEASLSAGLFHTDGYILVPASLRGPVDTPANSEHAALDLALARRLGARGRLFGRGAFFTEARNNGTPIQTNDTHIASAIAGVDAGVGASGTVSVRLYGDAQSYNQNFSAIAANRATESLTDAQHVPAQQLGGTAWWSQPIGRQTLGTGIELGEVLGASHEDLFSAGRQSALQIAGGRQRSVALFGEDIIRLGKRWVATGSMRFDQWRNFDAQSSRTPLAPPGTPAVTSFADRSETAFSPRLSVLYALRKSVSLTASAYRSFRSPTLNELYRGFRVGNVLTQANPDLRAERLTGAEAGASASPFGGKLTLRGNFFWCDITNPIANVTLSTTPSLIFRQRQNLGRTRSRGVELEALARLSRSFEISGGYQFVDATVVRFPANAALEGLAIPQVPQNQFTVQARYSGPSGFLLSLQGRFVGVQYDDDLNQLPLGRYFMVDLLAAHSLGRSVQAFAAFENLLNQRYTVGLTPVPTLGPPLLVRAGLRYSFPGRG